MANLNIKVIIQTLQAIGRVQALRASLNLLSSTFKAVFRTTAVVLFFSAFRAGMQTISQLKNLITKTVSEMAKLHTASLRTATVLTKGGKGTAEAFEEVSKTAREMSTQTASTAMEIQEGFFTAAIAGYNLGDSVTVATQALKMAQISGYDFRSTIEGVIGVVNAFSFTMEEIPQMVDTITTAFSNSKMTLDGFFKGMEYAASAAAVTFGDTMETFKDTAAALMTLKQAGLSDSKAGTYLRSAMLKLNSATTKVTSVLAKYGVNIYETNAETQKYVSTIFLAQKSTAGLYDELNTLKQAQLDVANASGTESSAFKSITKQVDNLTDKLGTLNEGISDVYTLFQEAGGKLRPQSEIWAEIAKKVPTEVMTRTFGIRSGQGIGIILSQMKNFEKFSKILDESEVLSLKGQSITSNMFLQMLGSIGVKWKQITNSISSSFSVIAEGLFKALEPVMSFLAEKFQNMYKLIERWKPLFQSIFQTLIDTLIQPMLDGVRNVGEALRMFPKVALWDEQKEDVRFPMFKADKEGNITKTYKTVTREEGQGKAMRAYLDSIFSSLEATFIGQFLPKLQGVFALIAEFTIDIMVAKLKTYISFFKEIGTYIGEGIIQSITVWFSSFGKRISEFFMQPTKTIMGSETLSKAVSFVSPLGMIGRAAGTIGALKEGGLEGLQAYAEQDINNISGSLSKDSNKGFLKILREQGFMEGLASLVNPFAGFPERAPEIKSKLNPLEKEPFNKYTTMEEDIKRAEEAGKAYWDTMFEKASVLTDTKKSSGDMFEGEESPVESIPGIMRLNNYKDLQQQRDKKISEELNKGINSISSTGDQVSSNLTRLGNTMLRAIQTLNLKIKGIESQLSRA